MAQCSPRTASLHHIIVRGGPRSAFPRAFQLRTKTSTEFQHRIVGVSSPEISNGLEAFLYAARVISPALMLHPPCRTHNAESEAPPSSVASQASHLLKSSLHFTEPHPSWLTQSR